MGNGGDTVDSSMRTAVSQAVVEAVAEAEDIPPEQLCPPEYEPLYSVIDPEALDALFAPQADGSPRAPGSVTFDYCGYTVTVENDSTVRLER